jgi:cardiolipin synthase A/B
MLNIEEPMAHDADALSRCSPESDRDPEEPIHTARHALVLLPGMEPMLRSIMDGTERACRRIFIETYIYADDLLGREFGEALARAAERGVPVRLLYDPLGSQKTDPAFFERLRARGVDVRAYRPFGVAKGPWSAWPRDHGRVMVVDDHAYTGGAAWADEWLPRHRGGKGWHDVCLRVAGPCVEDFAELFEQRWREADGEITEPRDLATLDKYPDLELVGDTAEATVVHDRYRAAIQRAKTRVWLENSYFFPPPEMLYDLYDAAARGVDVQVIVPRDSDLPIVQRAARSEYKDWIDHGLQILEYERCMLHSKFAVIDDDWSTVGTYNANPTIYLTNEVNVFVYETAFAARVARLFEADRESCRPVTHESLKGRPILTRVVDQLAADAVSIIERFGSK